MVTNHEVCGSRGPRIGEEGTPRCAQPLGHASTHCGYPGSGFERETWGSPEWRDMDFVRDWSERSLDGAE
jgi:hypothetical protein